MGLRNSIKNALTQPTSLLFEGSIRGVVEEVLANRGFVMPGDHNALRNQVATLEADLKKAKDLEKEIIAMKKKLNMAMGAIQASTAQLATLKGTLDQTTQRATSALATGEAASDGLTGLEDAFAALVERLGSQNRTTPVSGIANFGLLDGSISDLKKALGTGNEDAHLPALLAAEEAGLARVGALRALKQRMA